MAPDGFPPNIEPSTINTFEAEPWAAWGFFFFAGAAAVLIALPWAISRAVSHRHFVPLIVIASGFICSLVEPMLDTLGHLRWAENLAGPAFTNFGIEIPALIPFCYAAFLGLESYFIYVILKHGATVKQIMMIFPIAALTDILMETPGINLDVYEYYGVQPYSVLNFPWWWACINAASFMTVGFLIWFLEPKLQGWHKLYLLPVAPCGMMMAYFTVGWPHLLTLNADVPEPIMWIGATITMAGCVGWARAIAYFAAVPEDEARVEWTFSRLFRYTFSLPHLRERMIARWTHSEPSERISTSVEHQGIR